MWRRGLVLCLSPVRFHVVCPRHFPLLRSNHVASKRSPNEILETVSSLSDQSSYLAALIELAKESRKNPVAIAETSADPRVSELVSLLLASPINELSPSELADLLSSLAVLKIKQPQIMGKITAALQEQIDKCTIPDLLNILMALTKLEFKATELMQAMANRIVSSDIRLSAKAVIVILNCYAVFGVKHTKLLDVLSQNAQFLAQAHKLSGSELSNVLSGFGVFDYWNRTMLDIFSEAIIAFMRDYRFDAQELTRLFHAVLYFRLKGDDLIEPMCTQAIAVVDDMTATEICGMWVAQGQHQFKNPMFMPVFTDRALQMANRFTPLEVVSMLVSLSIVKKGGNTPPEPLVRRMCDLLMVQIPELGPQDILSALNAMAGLELRDRMDLIEALGGEARAKSREYSMPEGRQILEILQYLQDPEPEPKKEEPVKILRTDMHVPDSRST